MSMVGLEYQENSMGSISQNKKVMTEAEQKQMNDVNVMLESPGYSVLHKIMIEEITNAEKVLWDRSTPLEYIRYYQGIIKAVQNVQHKILNLSKEEGYGNT